MSAAAPNVIGAPKALEQADCVVLGSGPGGAVTACTLAEAGREVLLIEEGPYLSLDSCAPFSREEMLQKYRNGGITVALGAPKVAYVEGRCVGGGSEINSGLYHRTPPEILEEWAREFRLKEASEAQLRPHFEALERELSVSTMPDAPPRPSQLLQEGASKLGWKALEVPRWYRYEKTSDAKSKGARQSMTETFVPRALKAGARLLPAARALRIRGQGGDWRVRVEHCNADGVKTELEVRAKNLFLACGAIQTPALLQRSGLGKHAGHALHLHSTVKVVARFKDEINGLDLGVPVHQVKEFAPRFSFGCSIGTPPYLALALADSPMELQALEQDWKRRAIYYAMIRGGVGSVTALPFWRDPLVRYKHEAKDLSDLAEGLKNLCECLFAAGAETLWPSLAGVAPLKSPADLAGLPSSLPANKAMLMTIHLFSTCAMGEDQTRCTTDSFGRVHGEEDLYVADASLLCGAPGVNPQGSVMAFARRNALHFLGKSSG